MYVDEKRGRAVRTFADYMEVPLDWAERNFNHPAYKDEKMDAVYMSFGDLTKTERANKNVMAYYLMKAKAKGPHNLRKMEEDVSSGRHYEPGELDDMAERKLKKRKITIKKRAAEKKEEEQHSAYKQEQRFYEKWKKEAPLGTTFSDWMKTQNHS